MFSITSKCTLHTRHEKLGLMAAETITRTRTYLPCSGTFSRKKDNSELSHIDQYKKFLEYSYILAYICLFIDYYGCQIKLFENLKLN